VVVIEFLLGDKQVRAKALLVLIASVMVLGGGVYALHAFQIKRNARGLYDQFVQMKKEGRPDQALKYLEQYVNLKPSDIDSMAEFGILMADGAKSPAARASALTTLERVLRLDGTQKDVRLRAAKLAVYLGRYPDARQHLDILLKATPNAPEEVAELWHWYGRCETGAKNFLEAGKKFAKAVSFAPKQVDLALDYAVMLHDFAEDPEGAKEVIEHLVHSDPKALPARLESARFYARIKQWDQAEQHLNYVLKDRPDASAEAFLLAGQVALLQGDVDRARDLLKKGCEQYPNNDSLTRQLARAELASGDQKKALALLEPSLNKLPSDPEELWSLANLLIDIGGLEQASQVIARLPAMALGPQAESLQARVLMRKEEWGQASKMLEKALSRIMPTAPLGKHIYLLLAECYQRLDSPDQRLDACRRAVERDRDWTVARHALAEAFAANGKLDDALKEYLQLGPLTPPWRRDLARLLIAHNLRLPDHQRRWQDVEKLLNELAPKDREKFDTKVLEANLAIAQ
jgi:cellulose synthase operon protein C